MFWPVPVIWPIDKLLKKNISIKDMARLLAYYSWVNISSTSICDKVSLADISLN